MTDKTNFARLQRTAPAYEWRDKTKLRRTGFAFKGDKILCAAPRAVGSFCYPGVCEEAFRARLDHRDRVTQRTWTPVTLKEHAGLAEAIEPRTGEPHLVFAWIPLPAQPEKLPTPPRVPPGLDKTVELAGDPNQVEADDDDDNDAIPNAEPSEPEPVPKKQEKKGGKKSVAAKKKKSAPKPKSEIKKEESAPKTDKENDPETDAVNESEI